MNKNSILLSVLLLALSGCDSDADNIGDASTRFRILGKNDRIEIKAFDDPDVSGISCYLSHAKSGGLKETINLEEDTSDASLSCVQTSELIEFNEKVVKEPERVFKRSSNALFKSMQVIRYYDDKRKVFTYLIYSNRIIEGSPKNSISSVSCFGAGVHKNATNGVCKIN